MKPSLLLFPLLLLLLVGCGTEPGQISGTVTGRFTAQYQGVFICGKDDRENKRAIYVIVDTKTGQEYLAVQGCGTTELVTRGSGKDQHHVEQ